MLKHFLSEALVVVLILLGSVAAVAQQRVLTLDEVFDLAEQNSKTLAAERVALSEAQAAVVEAKTGRLPDIELSASASYLGNGTLTDRNYSNAMCVKMPHWGINLPIHEPGISLYLFIFI